MGLMAWNADRGWNGAGALERMSETRVELMDDWVMLFLGLGTIPEGVVDGFGTPRFNAEVRGERGRRERGEREEGERREEWEEGGEGGRRGTREGEEGGER